MKLQEYHIDKIVNLFAKAVDWNRRSIYNIGALYSRIFSTNPSNKAQRIEITQDGIFIYDINNVLIANFDVANAILTLDGMSLQINNAPAAVTTETVTDYIIVKDSGGNDIKLAVLT